MERGDNSKAKKTIDKDDSILDRLESAAEKSRTTFDGAITDFRNRFSVGTTLYEEDCDEN